jgi:EamA-like transporter family.
MGDSRTSDRLSVSAVAVAILVAAAWGFNFVVIKVGVSSMPPLMLAALRFLFSALPAVFFVRRPAVPMARIAVYGLLLGVGEFGFLFTAIKLGAPAGLSSIILQSQAFFTAALAALALKEKMSAHNVVGMAVAAIGLAAFALSSASGGMGLPLMAMVLVAGLGWAGANVVARTMAGASGLGLVVWSSLFSPLPLAALSLVFEGPQATASAFASITSLAIGALAYLVLVSTLFGYGAWNGLIIRYGAGRIAPFSLMVPVFGVLSAYLALGERLAPADAIGALLIMIGLVVHVLGGKLKRKREAKLRS